jgi:hypothetical protein
MKLDSTVFRDHGHEEFKGVCVEGGDQSQHPDFKTIGRDAFLKNYVKNKKVIHMGCSDHMPVIEAKRKSGTWLHDQLLESAASCVGIDNDKETIDYLTNNGGVPDLYCCDATTTIPENIANAGKWDVMVAGEIIEHIDNPVDFLTRIRNTWKGKVDELILTTPNAFGFVNFRFATQYKEMNNPDHRYWYTPHTLGKICYRAGFTPTEFYCVNKAVGKSSVFNYVHFLQKRFPMLRTTLIMKCKFN